MASQDGGDVRIVMMLKGSEQYVFLFDEAHAKEALRTAGRWAADHRLSFTWYDAAVLSQRLNADAHELEEMRNRQCGGRG
jgi:hypothetical protein